MPPSASSNLPRRDAVAPVNEPFSWPKSSVSSSSVGMAAQFTFTNGPGSKRAGSCGCGPPAVPCRCRIRRSAARAHPIARPSTACSTARVQAGVEPIIFGAPPTSSRRRSFSCRRLACSMAFFTASRTRSRLSGFSRKSNAPARVASTASAMVPWPEIMMAGDGSAVLAHGLQQVDAVAVRQFHVEQVGVGAAGIGVLAEVRHRFAHVHGVALALQNHAQRAADILFVIHDQHAFGSHWSPRAAARGNLRRPVLLSPVQCPRPTAARFCARSKAPTPCPAS